MKVGDKVSMGGYFTRLLWVAGQPANELEDRIGYHRGRLAQGYLFLAITETIRADEIELVGHSHFSGGRIGHPSLNNRMSAEDSLRRNIGDAGIQVQRQKIATLLNAGGSDTGVKVLPQIRHDPAMSNAAQYPVGTGIPQFNLTAKKIFSVIASVPARGDAPKVPDVLSALGKRRRV